MHKANEMGVPWLYIGSEQDDRVYFERVRLAVALGSMGDGNEVGGG